MVKSSSGAGTTAVGEGVSGAELRRRMARTSRTAAFESRRQLILKAAADLFRELGTDQTSLLQVAQRAKLDRATVYYYFSSKQHLFRELVTAAVVDNVSRIEEIAASERQPDEKLAAAISDLMDSFARHHPFLAVHVTDFVLRRLQRKSNDSGMDELKSLGGRYDRAMTRILEEGVEAGLFRPIGEPRVIAYTIIGMMNASTGWQRRPTAESSKAVGDLMKEMVLRGLLDGPTGRSQQRSGPS